MVLKIITDSTADLDEREIQDLGITVVPLTLQFGEDEFLDRVELGPEEFYSRLVRSHVLPRTSQPSIGRFQEVYTRLAGEGATEILSIHISSKLSGTLGAARVAAQQAPAGCVITTLDSTSVAGGLGAVVRGAAQAAMQGGDGHAAAEAARALIQRQQIHIMLDTLEYLQKGGRIGRARSLLGSMLNIKPIVRIQDGEVAPEERVRSRARGIERLYEIAVATRAVERVVVEHSGNVADADKLAARLRTALPNSAIETCWIGPVVGVYAGPNAIGVVTVKQPVADAQRDAS